MGSELQRLVDNLGSRLKRSVAIDDRNIRILAYNSHSGEVDPVRVNAIMSREVPQELVDYLKSLGGFDKDDIFVQPARPELGLTIERIFMPIRFEERLLGFLGLLASDGPLSEDEAHLVRQAAERASVILQREELLDELRQARVRDYMRDLLSGDSRLQDEACRRLIEEEFLEAGPIAALVVTFARDINQPLTEKQRLALAVALEDGCRRVPPRSAVHLERLDHGVLVVTQSGVPAIREIEDLAGVIHGRVCEVSGISPESCHVGIGERRANLNEAYWSYIEAQRAAAVARITGSIGAVARYSRLGLHGLLIELPLDRLKQNMHPGLLRLLEYDGENGVLIETLESFFSNAGDVTRTARTLNLHRASIRYRIRRIEEIARVDLSDGDDRFALQVGMKIAQLVKELA